MRMYLMIMAGHWFFPGGPFSQIFVHICVAVLLPHEGEDIFHNFDLLVNETRSPLEIHLLTAYAPTPHS